MHQACDWTEAAVGRIVLNMKKYEVGIWDNIIVVGIEYQHNVQKMKNMPKNISTWWTMKEKLEKADKEAEEERERIRDEQRRKAEEEYWAEKKRKEEEEKAKAEQEGETEEKAEETKVEEVKSEEAKTETTEVKVEQTEQEL